ncbi:MAG: hypothetical protein KJ896_03375, partial [Nanoarchaeota archaeon]|nr:hypothetical protein [Nanoarchaeota archaeon]
LEKLEEKIEVGPVTYHINITYEEFEPEVLDLSVGDTIVWHNLREEKTPRTAMIVGARNPYTSIRSEELESGETYSWTFDSPGTYWIVDGIDTRMDSKITVKGDGEEFREFREVEENITINITEEINEIEFEDICSDTCLLPSGLNSTEFTLVFEIEEGTELELTKIWFALEDMEPKVNFKIEVIDQDGNLIDSLIYLDESKLNNNEPELILAGIYNLSVTLNDSISEINFDDILINESVNNSIVIDYNVSGNENWTQAYAVSVPYEGTANIIGSANKLHTCINWNVSTWNCEQGWTYLKNITDNYTINLEIGGNAFAEANNLTEINYQIIKEDPLYDAIIDSVVFENQTLTVIFHHDSEIVLPIRIEGNLAEYELSQDESVAGENVTLIVPNWNNEYFRIYVGDHTEVVSFGVQKEFDFNVDVKDSKGDAVNVTLEFVDSGTEQVIYQTKADIKKGVSLGIAKKDRSKSNQKPGNGKKSIDTKIKEGVYDIKINPENNPIKEILINDVSINSNVSELIDIDNVNESENNLTEFIEVYAIDPTKFNFTSATVTIKEAKGTKLFKCSTWNFTTSTCEIKEENCVIDPDEPDGQICDYVGGWVEIMEIIPGQEYNITLTPDDPGFAEGSPSTGTADAGSYTFIVSGNKHELSSGTYTNTWADDSSYYCNGYKDATTPNNNNWMTYFDFNVSALNVTELDQLTFEWKGYAIGDDGYCGPKSDPAECSDGHGTCQPSYIRIYDWSTGQWDKLSSTSYTITSTWDDTQQTILRTNSFPEQNWYNDSSGIVRIAFEHNETGMSYNYETYLIHDYVGLTLNYTSQNNPTVPTSITCDGGNCNNTFVGDVEIQCSGSTDVENDTITYLINAYYYQTGAGNSTYFNAGFESDTD